MLVRTPRDLGLFVRDVRKKLALDQAELAQLVGVSRQWVVALEKGKPGASLDLVMRTLAALDVDIELRMSAQADQKGAKRKAPPVVDLDAIVDKARRRRS